MRVRTCTRAAQDRTRRGPGSGRRGRWPAASEPRGVSGEPVSSDGSDALLMCVTTPAGSRRRGSRQLTSAAHRRTHTHTRRTGPVTAQHCRACFGTVGRPTPACSDSLRACSALVSAGLQHRSHAPRAAAEVATALITTPDELRTSSGPRRMAAGAVRVPGHPGQPSSLLQRVRSVTARCGAAGATLAGARPAAIVSDHPCSGR